MPKTEVVEYCKPCKWYRDGYMHHGEWIYYCTHPKMPNGQRSIDNPPRRPDWCPIRNNPEAEKEASKG